MIRDLEDLPTEEFDLRRMIVQVGEMKGSASGSMFSRSRKGIWERERFGSDRHCHNKVENVKQSIQRISPCDIEWPLFSPADYAQLGRDRPVRPLVSVRFPLEHQQLICPVD